MELSTVRVAPYFDTRRSKKGEKYPVKIGVYYNGEKKLYKTSIDLTKEDWERIQLHNLRDDRLRIVKRKLHAFEEKAHAIIDQLSPFSYAEFEDLYYEERKIQRTSSLEDLFLTYINQLENNDQIGTAISYQTTLNSIRRFKKGLKVGDITLPFLFSYERYLKGEGLSSSSIGIYMRQLRCIINRAIAQGLMKQEKYPFKGYVIPNSRNVKKSLNENQLRALFGYKTDDQDKRKALDFWLFSYLSNGINMGDICLLKPQNFDKSFFFYMRAKTKNTKKKDLKPIKVPLTEESKQIIDRWKNNDPLNPYLFPILHSGLTAKQIKFKIQHFIAFVNKQMKLVAKDLEIDVKVGTYVARHSHSTTLKRKGVPTELIKENLGHSSVLVTESYLADFTDEMKQDYAKLLTDL